MQDESLTGRRALVTGGARGLGLAMALGLARAGASVSLVDIDAEALDDARVRLAAAADATRAMARVADVSDEAAIRSAIAATLDAFGGLDVLVNDAGIGPPANGRSLFSNPEKFWENDLGRWRRTVEVNTMGSHMMAALAVPHMIAGGWGRIVNVTTSLNAMYMAGCGAYGPSKAALEADTAIMAKDLEGTGVTANVLVPGGPADTRMIPADSGIDRAQLIPPERMVPPVVWLASPGSDGVTGMRFQAALWDPALAPAEAAERAGAPAAWPQLGAQAIMPHD
ncbi:MAG: SDR family NAD(P)-dependent oxidoreductase [Defluviicoccus sp.]|nr:SDR family NAD(P)-dependent oxidoreductase [Defluviicoccus sp.]MDE0386257.1 SDR family NAD(P)-dependent oxidoreductase [Defluviicoccus sp.]